MQTRGTVLVAEIRTKPGSCLRPAGGFRHGFAMHAFVEQYRPGRTPNEAVGCRAVPSEFGQVLARATVQETARPGGGAPMIVRAATSPSDYRSQYRKTTILAFVTAMLSLLFAVIISL